MRRRVRIRTVTSTLAGLIGLALVAAAAAWPMLAPPAPVGELFALLTMLVMAQLWNLLAGQAGLVSLGQQAFVGTGAYAMVAAVTIWGVGPLPAMLAGGAAALVLAIPAGFLAFRLPLAGFAVGTWIIAEVVRLGVIEWTILGGSAGASLPQGVREGIEGVGLIAATFGLAPAEALEVVFYWLALALAVLTIVGIGAFLRSGRGLALRALRDDAETAGVIGIDAGRARWAVYLVAAFGAGLTGALVFLRAGAVTPDAAFSVIEWTAFVVFAVMIGGRGTIEGPILGVLVVWFLRDALADRGSLDLVVSGLVALGVVLVAPRGLWGIVAGATGVDLFPVRRRLTGPGLAAAPTRRGGAPGGRSPRG